MTTPQRSSDNDGKEIAKMEVGAWLSKK